jgi:hypothetical protein
MSSVWIPMAKITQELCESVGYSTHSIIPRSIKNKTLPEKNKSGETMKEESLVVMKGPQS